MKDTNPQIRHYNITRIKNGEYKNLQDQISIEAPLEIRLKKENDPMSKAVAVTMRTPGDDELLALGFLFTEGIIKKWSDIAGASIPKENTVEITVKDHVNTDLKNADRNFYTTSSCGVCGKASIEAIKVNPAFSSQGKITFPAEIIRELPAKMNAIQSAFQATGGIHASALFDLDGQLQCLKEDVGRHNALDKLVGNFFQKDTLPLDHCVLLLSGRASFELVQKAAMAGIQVIAAVGAPSSLAIDLAIEQEITLIGFLKANQFNIYSEPHRIQST